MTDCVQVGVVGIGVMGRHYCRLVSQYADAQVAAVASRRADAREEMTACYGCHAYADLDGLLSHPGLDAVVIASDTRSHAAQIIACARARKDIFTEKPIALSLEDAARVREAVRDNGVRCMVGFMRRYDPSYLAAKRKIQEGVIGTPVTYLGISRDPVWPPHVDDDPRVSGGFWLDIGVHDYDAARWLMDSDIVRVQAIGGVLVYPDLRKFEDIDNGIAAFTFANGALGSANLSRNSRYGYDIRAEVLGSEGSLWIGSLEQTRLQVLTRAGVTHDVLPWYLDRFADAYRNEMYAFLSALREGVAVTPDAEDGYKALAVGLAVKEAWLCGAPVRVES